MKRFLKCFVRKFRDAYLLLRWLNITTPYLPKSPSAALPSIAVAPATVQTFILHMKICSVQFAAIFNRWSNSYRQLKTFSKPCLYDRAKENGRTGRSRRGKFFRIKIKKVLTFFPIAYIMTIVSFAGVAELADAQASGACGSNIVWVQVPSPASI